MEPRSWNQDRLIRLDHLTPTDHCNVCETIVILMKRDFFIRTLLSKIEAKDRGPQIDLRIPD